MVWILHILNAYWNAFVIKWKLKNDPKASKIWHEIGFVNRIVIATISLLDFIPYSYAVIVNPLMLFPGWFGAALTAIMNVLLGYWIYNIIINKINFPDKRWTYLGKGRYGNFWYASLFAIFGAGFLAILLIYFGNLMYPGWNAG